MDALPLDNGTDLLDALLRYKGMDLAGFVLTFASLLMLGNKQRAGFLVGCVASVAWAGFSVQAESIPTLTANGVFLVMNLRGYLRWSKAGAGA